MKQAITPGLGPTLKAIDERFWLRHGLFWLADFVFVVWFVLFGIRSATGGWNALQNALLLTGLHVAVTYPLLYGVVPALWREDRRGRLLLLLASWVVFGAALNYAHRYFILLPMRQSETLTSEGFRKVFAPNSIPVAMAPACVAACLRVYRRWRRQALANARLTRENVRAELRLLKAQLHPHFLFNTLNTLYALTLKQSDQAPEVVDRLTGLLQAVVAQGNTAGVALRDEVALLRDYVALEQLRYGPRLTLEFRATGIPAARRSSPLIAPLLLLPLVENAFKHGAAEQPGAGAHRHCPGGARPLL
ncbi:sensor histidine kinase [Hymenobacter humi]|uniref:Sensor histidine kinase n=1 Tax=Hymenobacter humi TaxID=1411620 RepID=A0ABW2U455_9BACT